MKHILAVKISFRRRHLLFFCAGTVVLFLSAVAQLGLAQSELEYPLSPASDFGDAKARLASTPVLYVSAYQGGVVQEFPGGNALASIPKPTGLALDPAGTTLYMATNSTRTQPATIYTIPVSGGTPTVFYQNVVLNEAHGLAFDSQGNLFVATASGNTILEFIAPFNPPPTPIIYADNSHDGINDPFSVIFDASGTTLYVSNGHGGQDGGGSVMKFTAQHTGSTVADSTFDIAYGLAFDQTFSNLYVSSAATQDHMYSIRFINIQTGVVSPFTTSGVSLNEPLGLLINGNTLFEADKGSGQIQKFSLSNGSGVVFAINVSAPHFLAIKP